MQITSPVRPAPATPKAAGEVIIRRGNAVPVAATGLPDINKPNMRFVRVHSDDAFALQGMHSLSYSSATPDQVKLRFETLLDAQRADAAMKDVVLGAKLVFADPKGTPYDMGGGFAGRAVDIARAVAAMPGVNSYRAFGTNSYLMVADSVESRVRLQQLVNRSFGSMMAYWKGECFGPGCKPDPKPPTGEWPPA